MSPLMNRLVIALVCGPRHATCSACCPAGRSLRDVAKPRVCQRDRAGDFSDVPRADSPPAPERAVRLAAAADDPRMTCGGVLLCRLFLRTFCPTSRRLRAPCARLPPTLPAVFADFLAAMDPDGEQGWCGGIVTAAVASLGSFNRHQSRQVSEDGFICRESAWWIASSMQDRVMRSQATLSQFGATSFCNQTAARI